MEMMMSSINTMMGQPLDGSNLEARVLSAQKGDLSAFNELVLLYQNTVYGLALRILGDEDSAEDVTQNTFLAAYRNLAHFRNGSLRNWLIRVATNACVDEIRRRTRHPVQPLEYENEEDEGLLPSYDLSSQRSLPEKEVERHELDRAIQEALNRLDFDRRAVVVLVDFQDFDYREVSHILGIPIGTVKSRLARARQQLSRMLSSFMLFASA